MFRDSTNNDLNPQYHDAKWGRECEKEGKIDIE